jgi:hypothetical protein
MRAAMPAGQAKDPVLVQAAGGTASNAARRLSRT